MNLSNGMSNLSHEEILARLWVSKHLMQIKNAYWCGDIPDVFRTDNYGPVIELELPDAKATDGDFEGWLSLYRISSGNFSRILLEQASCN